MSQENYPQEKPAKGRECGVPCAHCAGEKEPAEGVDHFFVRNGECMAHGIAEQKRSPQQKPEAYEFRS
jgi:hypothetical protein